MSDEVRDAAHEQPAEVIDGEAPAAVQPPADKLGDEGRRGIGALTEKDREGYQLLKSGGPSGVPQAFGKIHIFDSGALEAPLSAPSPAIESALTRPLGDRGANTGEKADDTKGKDKSAEAAAAEFEKRGHSALAGATKGLKYTTDGSAPRVVAIDEHYTLAAEKTPRELADERLGPSASKEQKEQYALALMVRNGDKGGLDKKIAAGTVLKMPGQRADGGISYRDELSGETITEWQDAGTLRIRPDGAGLAQYTTGDGWMVEIKWDSRDKQGSGEDRFKGNNMVQIDSSGMSVEKVYSDSKDEFEIRRFTHTGDAGRTIVGDYNPGDNQPHTITVTNSDKSTIELKPGKHNHFVSADGNTGMDEHFNIYSRSTEADGSVTSTYETGYKETRDSKGRIVHSEGKDAWGRACSYDYKAGEKTPHTVRVTPKAGEGPIEFKRTGNNYRADFLDADKKKVGTIELRDDGRIVYTNNQDKSLHAELKDGTTFDKEQLADGTARLTLAKGGENQVTAFSRKGIRVSETAITKDGREFTKTFGPDGGSIDKITIKNTDGSKTELAVDKKAEQFRGERKDASGNVLEKVSLLEDKLVYTDVNSGAVRGEKYSKRSEDSLIPRFVPGGYDKNVGVFTYKNEAGQKVQESFAPGRSDTVKADGSVQGSTVRGDKSSLKPSGEATVEHSDETGVRLNADNTIDRWGPLNGDSASGEKLSPTEASFVKTHADIDRRDVAEIHRLFNGDNTKLDGFYKQLEKIDTAENLSDSEKSALRRDLMHHVAFPAEIYQGRTPSCNVSVIERDMAMSVPDKYVATVVQAVSAGTITTADGTRIPLDPDNLKLADSSGRDLASRIFQTTAIQAEFYPRKEFRNSEDGVGRLYPSPFKAMDKPVAFAGMTMPHIADARYKMTGEEKGMTLIFNVNDLLTAFDSNGGQPMIIAVDGTHEPFGGGGPVGSGGDLNHVVTITRIDKGPPAKVYVANQWGLGVDHSTRETSIDASKLLSNMQAREKIGGEMVSGPGLVLTPGDHTKGYTVKRGKIVEDRTLGSAIARSRTLIPSDTK